MKQMNADYRDTYHFTGKKPGSKFDFHNKNEDSLNVPPDINATIKENPYKSNVEIEGSERVLKPDLSAIFRAVGPKHSRGGIETYLEPDSFVFSDDKSLALTKADHDLFELKTTSSFKAKDNTPSKVLGRNIPEKNYNRLSANLQSDNVDSIGKRSSAIMLDKYMQTLGNIAYVQEQKKGFPQGLPPFSQGTAPVYDTELKEDIMQQKQYAKYGGSIENPYKMAGGGTNPIDPYKKTRTKQGMVTPTGLTNLYNRGPEYLRSWEQIFPGISSWDNKKAQSAIYDYTMNSDEGMGRISEMWRKYGLTNEGRKYKDLLGMTDNGVFDQNHELAPNQLKTLKKAYVDGMFGARQLTNPYNQVATIPAPTANPPMGNTTPINITNRPTPPVQEQLHPNEPYGPEQKGIPVDWQFTPFQKESQMYNLSKWAGTKRYMPYRSHYNATFTEPSLLNPEQAVADVKAGTNQQIDSLSTLSPILRNAQASAAFGQYLNTVPGIRSQYDNQNAQIQNQSRQYNNQVKNQESLTNMQNDQNYYRESVLGRQNFDNMRGFQLDNFMNNRMRDVETNQSLAYNMLTQRDPAYGFDFRTGDFYRNPKNILDVQQDAKSDLYTQAAQLAFEKMKNGSLSMQEAQFLKSLAVGKIPFTQQKKGGRFNPYK